MAAPEPPNTGGANLANTTNPVVKNGYFTKTWGDGSRYEGEWVDDMMTGRGYMVWADGRRYDGEWFENRCNGRGVLTYKDGRRYEGEYKLDKMHGRGVYIWAEGARYQGEYKEDKKNGRGLQTWPSGARYEGEYVDSMQTGYGLMTWADGRRYEGYWVNSKCTGYGVLAHKDGRRYEGDYVNDKMQGQGVYTWANRAKYDGQYKDNKKNGHGLHTWPDGSMYEGEYLDGMQTGQGYMAWGDGRVYRGAWVQSKCTGFGVLTHADGRRYEGYYLKDKMHGNGVYVWADGRKYNGEYKNNLKHGQGVWTWPDGVMLEGQWADNLPCRHACTIIFSSYTSTQEVQPRIGLDSDATLQKLHEDAHAWRIEHGVTHIPPGEDGGDKLPAGLSTQRCMAALVTGAEGEELAPAGAACAASTAKAHPAGGGSDGVAVGANAPSRSAGEGHPAEIFRSLRAIAGHLEQSLVQLGELHSLADDQWETVSSDGPATSGPSHHETAGPGGDGSPGGAEESGPGEQASRGSTSPRLRLESTRHRLVDQVRLLQSELDRFAADGEGFGGGSEALAKQTEVGMAAQDLRERRLGEFSVDEVCDQLQAIGLGVYEAFFRERGVDGAYLVGADEGSLEEVGVTDRTHRQEIMRMKMELE